MAHYAGERISPPEAGLRRLEHGGHRICDPDSDWCIDGSVGGNGTDYINHSCDPNCGLPVAFGEIIILAGRDIVPGEELTVDYLSNHEIRHLPCCCRSAGCRSGVGHGKKQTPPRG
jgi:uncharacterized protein